METVFVLTYNTADNVDRRIVDRVFKSREAADAARKELIKNMQGFVVDTEIDEVPFVG